jgi:hypothetical protein
MFSRSIRKIRDTIRTRVHLTAAVLIAIAACASYGSLVQISAAPSPLPAGFRLSGIVREAGTIRPLPDARILVTSGANAGTSAVSDSGGSFTFANLAPDAIDLLGTKDGYLVAGVQAIDVSQTTTIDIRLYPTPPRDAHGAVAVARCNDESWSWAEMPALACTDHGGVATAYVRAHAARR